MKPLQNKWLIPSLLLLLLVTMIAAIAFGAVPVSPAEMWSALLHWFRGEPAGNIHEGVFMQLRLPRVLLCTFAGATLAVSGVLMQGLFRNPIVEPGLVGTSAGAAFGASIVFVLGPLMGIGIKTFFGPFLTPVFAFGGGLLATYLVYIIAGNSQKASILSLLLVGMAINALGLSGTGFMSYIARDPQARSITFWSLGTLSGASWFQVSVVGIVSSFVFFLSLRYARQLNALLLGEEDALYLGVDVARLRKKILLINTLMISVLTAFTGVISFVGLIVPHLIRIVIGSDNTRLLPISMILGAIILLLADLVARVLLAPAEIPIGIITSLVGAPVFIALLKKYSLPGEKGGANG